MKKRRNILRWISLVMFAIAVIFVWCALSAPQLGRVFYIGSFEVGPEEWRTFYKIYLIVMAALFVLSFFVKRKQPPCGADAAKEEQP